MQHCIVEGAKLKDVQKNLDFCNNNSILGLDPKH